MKKRKVIILLVLIFGSLFFSVTTINTSVNGQEMKKEATSDNWGVYHQEPFVFNVQNESKVQTAVAKVEPVVGSTTSLIDSFNKNFIVNDRWKLILDGLETTIVIALSSIIIGTLLGYGLCLQKLEGKRISRKLARIVTRLIQGIPILVTLMILYYVVLGNVDVSAILVAIIGFSVDFAAYVSEMMLSGIKAVDKGQQEAACAIGFTKRQAFRKVVFPQAIPHFIPAFKGQMISMVKMTSIVGYIAIQDLTKATDIIRSRTMEALLPLLVTAIIYYIFAGILIKIIENIEIRQNGTHKHLLDQVRQMEQGGQR